MRNNQFYKQMRQVVLDGDYTVEQVELATDDQIKTILDAPDLKPTFIANLRRCVTKDLIDQDDERNLQDLRTQVWGWLNTDFPDFEFERGREDDKPFVKIWLKGKPETPEVSE